MLKTEKLAPKREKTLFFVLKVRVKSFFEKLNAIPNHSHVRRLICIFERTNLSDLKVKRQ